MAQKERATPPARGVAPENQNRQRNPIRIDSAPQALPARALKTSQSPLLGALEVLQRGGFVFPVLPGGKRPLPGQSWRKIASNDPEQVRRWFERDFPGCNFGMDCGRSGLVVLDVDLKEGRNGLESLKNLEREYGHVGRPWVRTPSGGLHLYMDSGGRLLRNSVDRLGPGLDTRGEGGFVVCPGSVIDGRVYEMLHNRPFEPAPDWLYDLAGVAAEKTPQEPACEMDTPAAIAHAREYLRTAPAAVEGQGGDSRTFLVAAELKDFGLSEEVAFDLILEHFNPRCVPPWDPEELRRKVGHAFQYARERQPGALAAAAAFEVEAGGFEATAKDRGKTAMFTPLQDLLQEPPEPKWLIEGILDRGCLAQLFGAPGSMKTFLALDLGLALAMDSEWHGHEIPENHPIFYVAGEGRHGLVKRIQARTWGMDVGAVPFYASAGPVEGTNPDSVSRLIEDIRSAHEAPGLVILDTLARNYGPGDENSTKDMGAFVAGMDRLRAELGCAVLLIHHTGLNNTERARGASALRAALDWEYRLGVNGATRSLECTKSKDFEPPKPMHFKPKPVSLPGANGTEVSSVVLQRVDAPGPAGPTKVRLGASAQIALDALQECVADSMFDGEEQPQGVHVAEWRSKAYERGITPSEAQEAKKKAFQRSVRDLIAKGVVVASGDFYSTTTPFG